MSFTGFKSNLVQLFLLLFLPAQIYFVLFAVNTSHNRIAMHAHSRLGPHGGRSLSRFCVNANVDLWILDHHNACAEIQARLSPSSPFHSIHSMNPSIEPSIHPADLINLYFFLSVIVSLVYTHTHDTQYLYIFVCAYACVIVYAYGSCRQYIN